MIHAYNFVETNGDVFRKHHLDVYPHSLVKNVLLGNVDTTSSGDEIVLSAPQENALEVLSHGDVNESRKCILNL